MSDTSPLSVEAILKRGLDHHARGRLEAAAAEYRLALVVDPSNAAAARLSGMVEAQTGRPDRGERRLARSTRLDPENAVGWARLAMASLALAARDRTMAAVAGAAARRAVVLAPGAADPCAALGATRYWHADHGPAAIWNLRGHRIAPTNPDIARALAHGLRDVRLFDAAETVYGVILDRFPNDTEARLGRAVTRLVRGDLRGGWEDFEGRWKRFDNRVWTGEPVANRSVLLHAEQGFGDTLQFARYAPMVADRGATVTLEVHPSLVRFLGRLDSRIRVVADGGPPTDYDFQCPLMSLPHVFGTTLDAIPPPAASLITPPPKRAPGTPPSVGLVWAGNPDHRNDHNRSIAPELLAPLRDIPGTRPVSLMAAMEGKARAPSTHWLDELPRPLEGARDFADSADVVAGLDLVITVDTAMAHLAGTLGRPCWILLPHAPDWRWLIDRDDSPWYPSVRLFRQPRGGDWAAVIAAVADALRPAVATRQEAARTAQPGPENR